ncbi:hypothetical protein C9374_004212 [Naegleria lovaniensis]|uniref:RRM domain-containing protein n=1 Tax=Naegleria lovaniensis TaxID=51637 RepID=A0AA88KPC0_NAELO|nr:uncharacterized protein C9374_004212 [Naegleria lovaniensis]KAG2383541.1 hypothetical protein C9374_004212 [Naegleria lovaniensis]
MSYNNKQFSGHDDRMFRKYDGWDEGAPTDQHSKRKKEYHPRPYHSGYGHQQYGHSRYSHHGNNLDASSSTSSVISRDDTASEHSDHSLNRTETPQQQQYYPGYGKPSGHHFPPSSYYSQPHHRNYNMINYNTQDDQELRARTIYISMLPSSATEQDIKDLLNQNNLTNYSEVSMKNQPKGVAYVIFNDITSVTPSLALTGSYVKGFPIVVKQAEEKKRKREQLETIDTSEHQDFQQGHCKVYFDGAKRAVLKMNGFTFSPKYILRVGFYNEPETESKKQQTQEQEDAEEGTKETTHHERPTATNTFAERFITLRSAEVKGTASQNLSFSYMFDPATDQVKVVEDTIRKACKSFGNIVHIFVDGQDPAGTVFLRFDNIIGSQNAAQRLPALRTSWTSSTKLPLPSVHYLSDSQYMTMFNL